MVSAPLMKYLWYLLYNSTLAVCVWVKAFMTLRIIKRFWETAHLPLP